MTRSARWAVAAIERNLHVIVDRARLWRIIDAANACWSLLLVATVGVLIARRTDRYAGSSWFAPTLATLTGIAVVLAVLTAWWGLAGITGLRPRASRLLIGLTRWFRGSSTAGRALLAADIFLAVLCLTLAGLDDRSSAGAAVHRRDGYFMEQAGASRPISETEYRKARNREAVGLAVATSAAFGGYLIGLGAVIWDDEARHDAEEVERSRRGWRRRF